MNVASGSHGEFYISSCYYMLYATSSLLHLLIYSISVTMTNNATVCRANDSPVGLSDQGNFSPATLKKLDAAASQALWLLMIDGHSSLVRRLGLHHDMGDDAISESIESEVISN